MKVMDYIDKLSDTAKSVNELQKEITVQEVWHIWDTLVQRYEVIEITQLLHNFAKDEDLKAVLTKGLEKVKKQANRTENFANKYGIPLPPKAPEAVTQTHNVEEITDRYIYRRVMRGIQAFLNLHMAGFISAETPELRELFKEVLMEEISIFDNYFEYGKMKGWTVAAPRYRT
ncbi:DUF3231 family protein [Natronospora cellulosivora (SeqCode)]